MSDTVTLVADPFGPAGINAGAFAGLPQAVLQQFLTDCQTALHKLVCGSKEAVVTYGEGSGTKSVSFSRTNEGMLRNHIRELQILLGQRGRRHAISVGF